MGKGAEETRVEIEFLRELKLALEHLDLGFDETDGPRVVGGIGGAEMDEQGADGGGGGDAGGSVSPHGILILGEGAEATEVEPAGVLEAEELRDGGDDGMLSERETGRLEPAGMDEGQGGEPGLAGRRGGRNAFREDVGHHIHRRDGIPHPLDVTVRARHEYHDVASGVSPSRCEQLPPRSSSVRVEIAPDSATSGNSPVLTARRP